MQNFAVSRQRDCPGFIHREANFIAGNFARARAKAQASLRVYSADVRSRNTQQCMLDRNPAASSASSTAF